MQQALRGRFWKVLRQHIPAAFPLFVCRQVLDLEAAQKQQQNSLKTGLTPKDKLLSVGPKWIYKKVALGRQ